MNKLNTSVSFRLSRLSLAIAWFRSPSGGRGGARLSRSPSEAQADAAQPLTTSTVGTETVQFLRPATSDTASLLRDVPGVSLYGAGGVSSLPSIRGLADDRLRIKVDGMDLIASCPNHMNPPLSYIDPSNIRR